MRIRSIRLGHAPNCSSLGNVLNVLLWTQATVATLWVLAEGWEARRRRPEPGGGETRRVDDPPALVRVEPEGGGATDERAGPLEAHVQVTRDCGLPCPSCHIEPEAGGGHVDLPTIDARLAELASAGVLRVAFGGGEVLRHPDLPALVALAERHGLAAGATTSGVGDAAALRGFGQVNVSLDGVGETFRRARGYAGADRALDTIRAVALDGGHVGVNVVLDRATLVALPETVAAAAEAGAAEVQLLRLKPVGRARDGYAARRLTDEQVLALWPTVQALMAAHPTLTFRIDCALFPFLAAHAPDRARLQAFGFWGCQGGEAMVSVDTAGAAHPCSFDDGPVEPRWVAGVTDGPCGSCEYQRICRGGCHAVARFLTGERFTPDPECPRVIAARAPA